MKKKIIIFVLILLFGILISFAVGFCMIQNIDKNKDKISSGIVTTVLKENAGDDFIYAGIYNINSGGFLYIRKNRNAIDINFIDSKTKKAKNVKTIPFNKKGRFPNITQISGDRFLFITNSKISKSSSVQLYDYKTNKIKTLFLNAGSYLTSFYEMNDGLLSCAAINDKKLTGFKIYDMKKGEIVSTIEPALKNGIIKKIHLTKGGKYILIGVDLNGVKDSVLGLYDPYLNKVKEIKPYALCEYDPFMGEISKDYIITKSKDGFYVLYDTIKNEVKTLYGMGKNDTEPSEAKNLKLDVIAESSFEQDKFLVFSGEKRKYIWFDYNNKKTGKLSSSCLFPFASKAIAQDKFFTKCLVGGEVVDLSKRKTISLKTDKTALNVIANGFPYFVINNVAGTPVLYSFDTKINKITRKADFAKYGYAFVSEQNMLYDKKNDTILFLYSVQKGNDSKESMEDIMTKPIKDFNKSLEYIRIVDIYGK